jgi:hypothetical protein
MVRATGPRRLEEPWLRDHGGGGRRYGRRRSVISSDIGAHDQDPRGGRGGLRQALLVRVGIAVRKRGVPQKFDR